MNPKGRGELTEAILLAALVRKGFAVSIPFGNNQRYDFILDDGTALTRVQCKTGWIAKGCVVFQTASKNGFTGERRGYMGQADIFLVFCPDNETIYRVPIDGSTKSEMRLRLDPLQPSAPLSAVKWAKDYMLQPDTSKPPRNSGIPAP